MKIKPAYPQYIFKACWRGTALKFRVPGKTYAEAEKRAESMVLRMLGGIYCMDLKFIGVAED